METQATKTEFQVFKTNYTLYKHGHSFVLVVKYEYREKPEELKVLTVVPAMELTQSDMDEIDLHCWGDRAKAQSLEFLEEEIYPLLGFKPTEGQCCA